MRVQPMLTTSLSVQPQIQMWWETSSAVLHNASHEVCNVLFFEARCSGLSPYTLQVLIILLFNQTWPCVQNHMRWHCTVHQGYLDVHCRILSGICRDMSQDADVLGVSSKDETLSASLDGSCSCRVWQGDYRCTGEKNYPPNMNEVSFYRIRRYAL